MSEKEQQFNPGVDRPLGVDEDRRGVGEEIVFWSSPSGTVEKGTKEERDIAMEHYKER